MLSKVWSAATLGIDAVRITIEVDARLGQQPGFRLVGLPDAAVREAYSRVSTAHHCGVKKEASGFDLPITIGILHAMIAHSIGRTSTAREVY